jgi:predicted CopG family antitoxin
MRVAAKSPQSRQTITLTRSAFGMLDSLRGEMPKSVFVEELLAKEKKRRERAAFYRIAVTAYTPEVREETLKLNEETPIAAE